MKVLLTLLTLTAASVSLATAAPENATCPVKSGAKAKPSITVKHEGKEIAFCCNSCKNKFQADPSKYAK
jgi:YHS domain-containing protein